MKNLPSHLKRDFSVTRNEIMFIIPLLIIPDALWMSLKLGQGKLSFVSLIYILVFCYLSRYNLFKKIAFSKPLLIWATLTLYHLINASIKHVPEINSVDYLCGIKCYASICIFTFFLSQKAKFSFKAVFYSLLVWLVIAIMTGGYTAGERLRGDGFVSVSLGKCSALMAIAGIYWCIMMSSSVVTLAYRMAFPILVIILAQTRNAFGMVCVMLMGYYYSIVMRCRLTANRLVLSIFVFAIAMSSVLYVMDNTGLGNRFNSDIEDVGLETYKEQYETGTAFDYVAGERIIYYATGWEIFKNHPWTGIGLDNYQNYMGGNFPMHVEYMKHLAEGGIIAAVLWLMFIASLCHVIIKTKIPKPKKSMAWFTLATILFTFLFSVGYEQERQMILYGIILSMVYPSKGNFFNTIK